MKKLILLITALLVTVMTYSQKKELKQASKDIKSGSFEAAKTVLSSIEGQINNADDSQKAEFYLYKGQAYFGAAGNNEDDLMMAANALKKVSEIETTSGNSKYSQQAQDEIQNLIVKLVNAAIQDQNQKRYDAATQKLYTSYSIRKTDTLYLYYAAANAMNAKAYDKAMTYYEELYDLGYTGKEKVYVATNKETGEVESFGSEQERKVMLLTGNYIKPETQIADSKRPSIIRDLAILYIEKENPAKAKELIAEARKQSPNDIDLIKAEANIALQMDDMESYNALMLEVVNTDPDNPEIYYNLGVSSFDIGKTDKAIEYYKKTLALDPDFTNAKINIAVSILDKEADIIQEMNSLGTSAQDNKRYDELRAQREQIYKNAVPYLEGAVKDRQNDIALMRTLMNIYSVIGDDEKFKEIKAQVEALEQ